MTPKQKAAIDRARQQPARFVDIPHEPRPRFYTAQERAEARMDPDQLRIHKAKQAAAWALKDQQSREAHLAARPNVLEIEQQRLIETWRND